MVVRRVNKSGNIFKCANCIIFDLSEISLFYIYIALDQALFYIILLQIFFFFCNDRYLPNILQKKKIIIILIIIQILEKKVRIEATFPLSFLKSGSNLARLFPPPLKKAIIIL